MRTGEQLRRGRAKSARPATRKRSAPVPEYPMEIRTLGPAEGGGFLVEFPDLPGCMADGATVEEAIREASDALRAWLATARECGDPIPTPHSASRHSGKWLQRVPKSLHRQLSLRARQEGVSLNPLATMLLAEGLERRGRG